MRLEASRPNDLLLFTPGWLQPGLILQLQMGRGCHMGSPLPCFLAVPEDNSSTGQLHSRESWELRGLGSGSLFLRVSVACTPDGAQH